MVRKAKLSDARSIYTLVGEFARRGLLLPRSLNSIYEHIRDFWVYEEEGEVVGCAALQVIWEDLAEIRSLAVKEDRQGEGIGRELVEACLREAKELGIGRVFSLTYAREFFERMGFRPVEKSDLPHKVWGDCVNCVKFPECDETAVIIDLRKLPPAAVVEEKTAVKS